MTDDETPKLKRRHILAGLAGAPAVGAGLALGAGHAKAQDAAAQKSSVPSTPPGASERDPEPETVSLTVTNPGSDFMVDVIKSLDIDYIATLPGASFRGLQESLVNYGDNKKPELLTCLHEDTTVGMAHGYTKTCGKPMIALVTGVVGLQHCLMSIYNAYTDRVPVMVMVGNAGEDSTKLGGEWNHSAHDQGIMVRDYVKWDVSPVSLQDFAENTVRAYDIMTSAPMAPVMVIADSGLQEEAVHDAEKRKLFIPKLEKRYPPAGDPNAVREAAKMLVNAENPVIYVDRYTRGDAAHKILVELAETLQAAVVNARGMMNFLNRHPLNQSERDGQVMAQADVVLALEPINLFSAISSAPDIMSREVRSRVKPGTKIIKLGLADTLVRANYKNYQRYSIPQFTINGDAAATLPSLIEEINRLKGGRSSAITARGDRLRRAVAGREDRWKQEAAFGWDASPISTARLSAELWDQIQHEDWMLATEQHFLSNWPFRLWDFDRPDRYIGMDGASAVGYNTTAALGAALANKERGRLTVAICGDGDFLMTPTVLWTAAYHKIPMLMIIHNNRAYHQEVMHMNRMTARRMRGLERAHIGTEITNPNIDYAKLAQGFGIHGEGPIVNPSDLQGAISRAIAAVKRGEPALIDVVSQPR